MTSPLLGLPGAVAGDGIDAPVAAHYGSFHGEQRALVSGDGFVDLSHRDVVRIEGPDRLTWLHSPDHAVLRGPRARRSGPRRWCSARRATSSTSFTGVDDGTAFVAHTEPGAGRALADFLDRMRFMMRVEVSVVTDDVAVAWRVTGDGATYDLVPRDRLEEYAAAAGPAAGLWAFEALRIERGEPRFGVDTDHRTIPNEVGWIGPAVHLEKGCYRGQETVARVHTLGRPPRRLTLLHLDGSENRLPAPGSAVTLPGSDRQVGFLGSSARHHELGPIALALLKRNVPVDAELVVDGMPVAQEVVVDPEVGLHVRPQL